MRPNLLADKTFYPLFSVEEINKLVAGGIPFRDAYKIVGNSLNEGTFNPARELNHTHEGSINNLCNEQIAEMMHKVVGQLH